jgi:hypothetical protein
MKNELMFNIPILLIAFNRPDQTEIVFDHVRSIKPTKLFIACDGPRDGNISDKNDIDLIKKIVENVDWECECKYLFRPGNLGCGRGPANAISWFFEHVDKGIILEDDCVPTPSFFKFCEEMLIKYQEDSSIMAISGTNVSKNIKFKTDYIYSSFPIMWGWATWKRAWEKYDFEMREMTNVRENKNLITHGIYNWRTHPVFNELFESTYKNISLNNIDVWDHQWIFCNWLHNGLTVTSTRNLIHNIGFGDKATHTFNDDLKRSNLGTHFSFPPYKGPSKLLANKEFDLFIAKKWFTATWLYYFKIQLLKFRIVKYTWTLIKKQIY